MHTINKIKTLCLACCVALLTTSCTSQATQSSTSVATSSIASSASQSSSTTSQNSRNSSGSGNSTNNTRSSSTLASNSFSQYAVGYPPLNGSFIDPQNWQGTHPTALARGWYPNTGLGASFADRWLFLPDGTFHYTVNELGATPTRYLDGTWEYTPPNNIELTIYKKIVLEGGKIALGGTHIPQIVNGTLVKYKFSEATLEHKTITVETLELTEKDEMNFGELVYSENFHKISIDGQFFYHRNGIDYSDMLTYWQTFEYLEEKLYT